MAVAVAAAGAGIEAIAATGGVAALWAAICSLASFRSFLRIQILSCMVLTRRSILESICSSRIFSIQRAAATTSSFVRCSSFLPDSRSKRPGFDSQPWQFIICIYFRVLLHDLFHLWLR